MSRALRDLIFIGGFLAHVFMSHDEAPVFWPRVVGLVMLGIINFKMLP